MARQIIQPVKLITALLFAEEEILESCLDKLEALFGPRDFHGEIHPFAFTNYYRAEMGGSLKKILVSFHNPVSPESLVEIKRATAHLEQDMSLAGKRQINIDPGYLDFFKLVLASFKERGNKIYLGEGVWADLTLYYEKSGFHTLPWSFPDFQTGLYHGELLQIRGNYKHQLRKNRR